MFPLKLTTGADVQVALSTGPALSWEWPSALCPAEGRDKPARLIIVPILQKGKQTQGGPHSL